MDYSMYHYFKERVSELESENALLRKRLREIATAVQGRSASLDSDTTLNAIAWIIFDWKNSV